VKRDDSTAERILAAAEFEFAAVGYASARLADIGERAGIRRPSLLYHFASKELLYQAVVERAFDQLGAELVRSMALAGEFEARLDALVDAFASFLDARPSLAPIIVRELIDDPEHDADAGRRGGGPGRAIMLERVAPLLGTVEAFIRAAGSSALRPGLPIRAAVVQVAGDLLLRSAAGSLRTPLWGAGDHARALARILFFPAQPTPASAPAPAPAPARIVDR
jgi:AcrR family transcriptional regulator